MQEVSRITELLAEAARVEVMPRWRKLGSGDVDTKSGPFDLVTAGDRAAEAFVEARLASVLPGAVLVGEEGVSVDPSRMAAVTEAETALVLDPIDGTANFAAGLPLFAVMAALVRRGETVAAWIHDPIGRDTAIAVKGGGAWIEDEAGERRALRVRSTGPDVATMTACISHRYPPEALRPRIRSGMGSFGAGWELRCAGHEYRLAAQGHVQVLLFWKLMPWDHLPGVLIHAEAGGVAACWDGSPYRPGVMAGGLLLAPDQESWTSARDALLPG